MFGAALLLNSCLMSDQGGEGNFPRATGKVQLTLEIEDLKGTTLPQTRGAENTWSVAGESTITGNLYLLFFEAGDKPQDQKYAGKGIVELPGPSEESTYGGTSMNVDGFDFPTDFKEDAYTVLALGNVGDGYFLDTAFEDWNDEEWVIGSTTLAEVLDKATGFLPSAAISSDRLPMVGRFDKPEDEANIHLLMERAVSRLDVTNVLSTHSLVSVSVWNSFPETSIWGEGITDYSASTKRIRRHYDKFPEQIDDPESDDSAVTISSEKIRGGLYAFENQVKVPEDNDEVSTCLIVGLKEIATGNIYYYRANIIEETGSQNLRRNYAYNLIISGFADPAKTKGATTEEIAYMGKGNDLIVRVGEWSEDSNGLVVSDQYSTLSVSTKMVNMGGSETSGSVAEITVHTFSTLPSPAPLQIHSQTYRPALNSAGEPSIEAELEGNTLVIRATRFDPGQDSRNGVIVLSYAGLEIAVSVSQAGKHNDYLIVTEPEGGILPYLPYAGQYSGLIDVKASGEWTARLYMPGFSFDGNTATDPVEWIWTQTALTDSDGHPLFTDKRGENNRSELITPGTGQFDGKFRVYSHSANTSSELRQAFIIVQLDKDPDAYSSVIMLSQNYIKALKYSTTDLTDAELAALGDSAAEGWQTSGGNTITFDGNGDPVGNNSFYINPGRNTQGTAWQSIDAAIVADGTGSFRDYFIVKVEESATDLLGNKITVTMKADDLENAPNRSKLNMSGEDRLVKVRVMTDPSTYAEFNVVQKTGSFNLMPGVLDRRVSPYGGLSDQVSIDVGETTGLFWRITNLTQTQTRSANGRQLVNHKEPTIEVYQPDGTTVPFEMNKQYPQDYKFAVKFAQIYYPNRGIFTGANVTVAVSQEGNTTGGMLQTISATQEKLVSRGVKVAARGLDSWGFGGLYSDNVYHAPWWYQRFNNPSDATNIGWSRVDPNTTIWSHNGTSPTSAVNMTTPIGQTYLHLHLWETAFRGYPQWIIEEVKFREVVKESIKLMNEAPGGGVTFFVTHDDDPISSGGGETDVFYGPKLDEMLGGGYTFTNNAGQDYDAQMATTEDFTGSKFHTFFVKKPYYLVDNVTENYSFSQGSSSPTPGDKKHGPFSDDSFLMPTQLPDGAVPLLVSDVNTDRISWAIDPKKRIIFIADPYTLDDTWVEQNKQIETFFYALRIWATKTAQYGSSFSDMFIEDGQPGAVPAPWDPIWGANALDLRDDNRDGRWGIRSAVDED
jgi:hypothetical protein